MPLFSLIAVLVVIGLLLYAINVYIPMDAKIKNILNIVVVIVFVIWLLGAFGLLDSINTVHVGHAANAHSITECG